MPRYNVEHNGKWACFSSISDGFVTEFMNKPEYEKWRKHQYEGQGYIPLEQCNIKTIEEAAFSIRLIRTSDEAIKCLLESGLSELECEQIMNDIEADYYCPVLKENGNFECPNCHKEIKQGQTVCSNNTCCLDFVWK